MVLISSWLVARLQVGHPLLPDTEHHPLNLRYRLFLTVSVESADLFSVSECGL